MNKIIILLSILIIVVILCIRTDTEGYQVAKRGGWFHSAYDKAYFEANSHLDGLPCGSWTV
jgi:hypothetical protein